MNRTLRLDGTWYKRNGKNGSNVAWYWDYLNNPAEDTVNLNANLIQFEYTPAGNVPDGAYNDDLTLNTAIVSFSYTL